MARQTRHLTPLGKPQARWITAGKKDSKGYGSFQLSGQIVDGRYMVMWFFDREADESRRHFMTVLDRDTGRSVSAFGQPDDDDATRDLVLDLIQNH